MWELIRPAIAIPAWAALFACQDAAGGLEPDAGGLEPDARDSRAQDSDTRDSAALDDAHDVFDDAGAPTLQIGGRDFAVTSDDYLAFESGGGVSVVPLAGGSPEEIMTGEVNFLGSGRIASSMVVGAVHSRSAAPAPGRLTLWSAATGATTVAVAAWGYTWAVDPTGTWACHDEYVGGGKGDLMLSRVDGTRTTRLASAVLFSGVGHCTPIERFVGATLLFRRCNASGPTRVLTALSPATGGEIELASDVVAYDVDGASEHVVVLDGAGTLSVIPIGGGDLVLIDRGVETYAVAGKHVVYLGAGGVLRRSALDSPAPVTLAASVTRMHAVSLDASRVAYATEYSASSGWDVHVVAAGSPFVSMAVTTSPTERRVEFTSEGGYVLFGGTSGSNRNNDDLSAWTSARVDPLSVTTDGSEGWLQLGATRVLYTFNAAGPGAIDSDLGVIDLATERRLVVARRPDSSWMVTSARDRVVYNNGFATIMVQPI